MVRHKLTAVNIPLESGHLDKSGRCVSVYTQVVVAPATRMAPSLREGETGDGVIQSKRVLLAPGIKKGRHFCRPFRGSGGGGGSRTRVRKPSDPGSTCLAHSIFSRRHAARGAGHACRPVAVWFNIRPRNST